MNQLAAKWVQGWARLAFWRKRGIPSPPQPESPDPQTSDSSPPVKSAVEAIADPSQIQTGWLARLKHALRRRRNSTEAPLPASEHTGDSERPSGQPLDASTATEDGPPLTQGFFARLKNTFRRQSKPTPMDVDAPSSSPGGNDAPTASHSGNSVADAEALRPNRMQRVRSLLSNKGLWIVSVSIMLLAIIVTLVFMLSQSRQEQEHLQAELLATQKSLGQARLTQRAATPQPAAPQSTLPAASPQARDSANAFSSSPAEIKPDIDIEDCVVTDKDSVIKNLSRCIEHFNRSMAP